MFQVSWCLCSQQPASSPTRGTSDKLFSVEMFKVPLSYNFLFSPNLWFPLPVCERRYIRRAVTESERGAAVGHAAEHCEGHCLRNGVLAHEQDHA